MHLLRTFAMAFVIVTSTVLGATQAPDVSGAWNVSVDVGGTHGDPTLVLKQTGQGLSGTITNRRGTQKITGMLQGNKAVFGFLATRDGATVKATYEGTVESATRMSGRVEFTGSISGTGMWVATKK